MDSDHKYRFLFETASDAIYLINKRGHIVDVNKAAEHMLGYSRKQFLKAKISDIDPNFSLEAFKSFWDEIPFETRHVFTTTHKNHKGELIPVEVSGSKFMIDGEVCYYGIARDIQEREITLEKLRNQNEIMELLSHSATVMLELPDIKSIHNYICQTIHQRYPKTVVLVISVDEKNMITRFGETAGLEDTLVMKLIDVIGFDIFKKTYRILPKLLEIWKKGNFHTFEGGLADFSGTEFPAMGARFAQKLFNIKDIHTIGINKGGQLMSCIHIFARSRSVQIESGFVESFVKQAGIVIQRKMLEDELQFKSMILDQIHDSVTVTDLDGIITYVNRAEVEMSKRSQHELVGQKVDVYGENTEKSVSQQQIIQNTLQAGVWRGEVINYTPDGQEMVLDVRTQCVRGADDVPVALVGVATDITQRKAIENELIQAKEKAEVSDRLKSAFLANISHEIRTPMNGILGFVDLISEAVLSETQRHDYLRIIQESGHRLLNTIDDILAASRIETDHIELHLQSIDLNKLMMYQFDFFQTQARSKGIDLIYDQINTNPGFALITDEVKLNSILNNLLKNSIKYTNAGIIRFGYQVEDQQLKFFVEDTSIGIPAGYHESVFDRFMQVDTRVSRLYEGSGLGLTIAKAYVGFLGGKIWLQSEIGTGTTFFFTHPLTLSVNSAG